MAYVIFTKQQGVIDLGIYSESPISMLDAGGVQLLLMYCEKGGYMPARQILSDEIQTIDCQKRIYKMLSKYISTSQFKELLQKLK